MFSLGSVYCLLFLRTSFNVIIIISSVRTFTQLNLMRNNFLFCLFCYVSNTCFSIVLHVYTQQSPTFKQFFNYTC